MLKAMSTWDRAALALQASPRERCWVEYTAGDGSHYYYNVSSQVSNAPPSFVCVLKP